MRQVIQYLDRRLPSIFVVYLILALASTVAVIWFGIKFNTYSYFVDDDNSIMGIQMIGLQIASVVSAVLLVDVFTEDK